MSFPNLDLTEEKVEPDFCADYPYGDMVEPYDKERDEEEDEE